MTRTYGIAPELFQTKSIPPNDENICSRAIKKVKSQMNEYGSLKADKISLTNLA